MKLALTWDYCRSMLAASLRFGSGQRKLGLTAHVLENTPEPYVFESTMRELCVSEVSIFRYVLRSPAA